jgi:tetratricopeptide (TPR) repeat protein
MSDNARRIVAALHKAVDQDKDFQAALDHARRIMETCAHDREGRDAEAVALRGDGLFQAICIEASSRVLDMSKQAEVREVLKMAGESVKTPDRVAMLKYVEGTMHLRDSPSLAREKFNEALGADPYFVVARLGIGVSHFVESKWKDCFAECKQVLAQLGTLAPNMVRVLMGVCAFRLQQYEHAKRCLDRALHCDPDDDAALLAIFQYYVHFRDTTKAAQVIHLLIDLNPSTVVRQKHNDYVFLRAIATDTLRDVAPALKRAIDETVRAAGDDVNLQAYARMQKGRVHHALGEWTHALEEYTAAIQRDPRLLTAVVHRAMLERQRGDRSAQIETLRRGMELADRDPTLVQMAVELNSTSGEHSAAIAISQRLVETVAKDRPEAYSLAAWANRLDPSSYSDMATVANQLRAKMGRNEDVALKANTAVLARDLETFVAVAKQAVGINLAGDVAALTEIGPREFPYVFNYAYLLERLDGRRARHLYIQLVKKAPSQPASYERLVHLAQQANRPAEAYRWARLLRAANPHDMTGIVLSAWVLRSLDHLVEALDVVRNEAAKEKRPALAICMGSLYMADVTGSRPRMDTSQQTDVTGSGRSASKLNLALSAFRYALDKDHHNVLAAHGAACAIACQGHYGTSSILLERVAEIDCNVPTVKDGVREHRFNVLVEMRAYRPAIATMAGKEKLSKYQRCALALCHTKIGEHAKAIEVLNVALAENPKDSSVCFYMTFTLLAAIFDTITSPTPVSEHDGIVAQERLTRASGLATYAMAVRGDEQRKAVKRIMAFVSSGTVRAAIHRRVSEREAELQDAKQKAEAWRTAAEQERQKREAEEERRRLEFVAVDAARTEEAQNAFQKTQELLMRWGTMPALPIDGEDGGVSHDDGEDDDAGVD